MPRPRSNDESTDGDRKSPAKVVITVPPVRSSGGTVAVNNSDNPSAETGGTVRKKVVKRVKKTKAAPAPAGNGAAAAAPRGSGVVASGEGSQTAAKHTYDKAYKKWEKFDVDAALESGVVTGDVSKPGQKVSTTSEFGDAVVAAMKA